MANSYFQFKQFTVQQDKCGMKVTTDGCLFGAWVREKSGVASRESIGRQRLADGAAGVGSQDPIAIGSGVGKVLDIGTGTGLLALMLAQENQITIDAIEIDTDASEQASENIAASPWHDKIEMIHGDARKFGFRHQYDTIICNPPFYENELKGNDPKKNIAHHNESLLLPELLNIIKKNLAPGGSFYLLLPYKRNEEIKDLLKENDLTVQQLTFVRQTVNHDYFRIMLEGKLKTNDMTETKLDEISIKDDRDQYTPAFTDLLKDYYLHL